MNDVELIPQALLRKYILYARENIHPKLEQMPADRMVQLFSEMRKESQVSCPLIQ